MQPKINQNLDLLSAKAQLTKRAPSPKTPFVEVTIILLTELLTDFETQVNGMYHALQLSRFNGNREFQLIYSYHDGHRALQRTMLLTANDAISVRARHDKIIEHFNRNAADAKAYSRLATQGENHDVQM